MKDKKSFILYCDILSLFDKLSDERAGQLIKHIIRYVNDLNPEPPSELIDLLFEPIKQQLKRDLREWEEVKKSRSESGRLGGIKSGVARQSKTKQNEAKQCTASENEANEAKVSYASKNEAKEAVNDDVNGNLNDNDNVNGTVNVHDTVSANGNAIENAREENKHTHLEKNFTAETRIDVWQENYLFLARDEPWFEQEICLRFGQKMPRGEINQCLERFWLHLQGTSQGADTLKHIRAKCKNWFIGWVANRKTGLNGHNKNLNHSNKIDRPWRN